MTQIKATYVDHMGSDLSVVNAARVSFGKKSEWEYGGIAKEVLSERDTKLIKYLARHKHLSHFGHAFASFHIKAPIFVARQLVKHKFLRWNEISRRYVFDEPESFEPEEWRKAAANVKQGSSDEIIRTSCVKEDSGEYVHPRYAAQDIYAAAVRIYGNMVAAGVCAEQARMVLPQSTMTEWYWSGSLDAFADMCRLRCKEDTQYETRVVANQISDVMQGLYPVAWGSLMEGENT